MRGGVIIICSLCAVGIGAMVLAVSGVALALCRAADAPLPAQEPLVTVYDAPGEGMTVAEQADGPLYDAPPDVEQTVVCDRDNRMYILLRTPEGGIAITPYLDRDGSQRVMPRP